MQALKDKFSFGKKGGGKGSKTAKNTPENEMACNRQFFSQFETKLMACNQPSARIRAQMAMKNMGGKSKKQQAYPYSEKHFASFTSKLAAQFNGNLSNSLQAMGTTYEEIVDLKVTRDSRLKADVLDPMSNTVVKELNAMQKLSNECKSAQKELASAEKNREKNGDQNAIERREKAIRREKDAQQKFKNALNEFNRDEAKRIRALKEAAKLQMEYHKQAQAAFQTLYTELDSIVTKCQNDSSNLDYEDVNGGATGSGFGAGEVSMPQADFGYSTTVGGASAATGGDRFSDPPYPDTGTGGQNGLCRVLYDFDAETDDDLALKKDDMVTILEKTDEQWFYGELNGSRGHFPVDFVEVINPV